MAKEKAASASSEVLEKIRKIQEEADRKKSQLAEELKEEIDTKRRELETLERAYNEITGRHMWARKVDGHRMTNMRREELVAQLPRIITGRMKNSDIIAKLGIAANQWNTLRKAAGKGLKMYGNKANAEYSWEG